MQTLLMYSTSAAASSAKMIKPFYISQAVVLGVRDIKGSDLL